MTYVTDIREPTWRARNNATESGNSPGRAFVPDSECATETTPFASPPSLRANTVWWPDPVSLRGAAGATRGRDSTTSSRAGQSSISDAAYSALRSNPRGRSPTRRVTLCGSSDNRRTAVGMDTSVRFSSGPLVETTRNALAGLVGWGSVDGFAGWVVALHAATKPATVSRETSARIRRMMRRPVQGYHSLIWLEGMLCGHTWQGGTGPERPLQQQLASIRGRSR
jgi:hypothetical protein